MALAHHSLREVRLLDPSAGDPSRGVRPGRVARSAKSGLSPAVARQRDQGRGWVVLLSAATRACRRWWRGGPEHRSADGVAARGAEWPHRPRGVLSVMGMLQQLSCGGRLVARAFPDLDRRDHAVAKHDIHGVRCSKGFVADSLLVFVIEDQRIATFGGRRT
jgi:hypothetical protein